MIEKSVYLYFFTWESWAMASLSLTDPMKVFQFVKFNLSCILELWAHYSQLVRT